MNVIRKEINSNLELPIWFIDKDTKKPEQELPSHLHDWHEIIFIHKGKGDFYIDSQFYPVMSGDIAIIPQNTVHFAIPDANQLITSSIIYFHPASAINNGSRISICCALVVYRCYSSLRNFVTGPR